MNYEGPDRRRHKLLITKNTEYHLRDELCVAVRDARSGDWKEQHDAVGSKLVGGFAFPDGERAAINFGTEISVGQRLCFSSHVMTSPVRQVERPKKELLRYYRN